MATATHLQNLDLFCVETTMEEEEEEKEMVDIPCPLQEQEQYGMLLFWDDQELLLLSSKEKEDSFFSTSPAYTNGDPFLFSARMEGVWWLVMASSRLGFTAQTTILAVNYFDRFMSSEGRRAGESQSQPWLTQLSAVACLSLAAKVEETRVPLLLDLQVEETRFVFEAKTIQRMELLVLSTLGWRMNPVTPLSFVDHIVRRMASKNDENKHWEFQRRCHSTLLSLIADSRWLRYLPSVLAAATMLFVLEQLDFDNHILTLLNTTKVEVDGCYRFILESMSGEEHVASNKRKHPSYISPSSPNGIIGSVFSFDSSNDSWSSVMSSSLEHPLFKRPNNVDTRAGEDRCPPTVHRVFV